MLAASYQPPPVFPLAHHPFDPAWQVHNIGYFNVCCPDCGALHWLDECLAKSPNLSPKFGMCFFQGKILLPPIQHPPIELYRLLTSQEPPAKLFCQYIHNYDSALAMTSVVRILDDSLHRQGGGLYYFRLHGELIYKDGSLLPPLSRAPVYAQMYIHHNAEHAHQYSAANAWHFV